MEDDYTFYEDDNVQHEEDTHTEEDHHPSEEGTNEQHPNSFNDISDEPNVCQGLTDDITTSVEEMTTQLQQRIEERLSQSEVGVQSTLDDSHEQEQVIIEESSNESSPVELEVLFEDSHNNNDEELGTGEVTEEDIEKLQEKAQGVEREQRKSTISFGSKVCPTRHGCSGATSCDCSYSDYPH